ncbi:MAG: c-type cytochrome, partial [Cyclobacteriaceae bacterium]
VWLVLLGCSSSNQRDTKFQQYYVSGEQLYVQHCSNCHQKNGSGLGLVYPPLAKSDYMEQNVEQVLCLMKYGQAGEISVNGNVYNKEMKGIFSLTDLEVAEIATYIYNTWQHEKGMIDISDVTKAHQKCDH